MILTIFLLLAGFYVIPRRSGKSRPEQERDYRAQYKEPEYRCDSCSVPHKSSACGRNRFINCPGGNYRGNIKGVGKCTGYKGVLFDVSTN